MTDWKRILIPIAGADEAGPGSGSRALALGAALGEQGSGGAPHRVNETGT
jgi:hypothetical protein